MNEPATLAYLIHGLYRFGSWEFKRIGLVISQ